MGSNIAKLVARACIQEIEASRNDIRAGHFLEQSDLDTEIEAWLRGK